MGQQVGVWSRASKGNGSDGRKDRQDATDASTRKRWKHAAGSQVIHEGGEKVVRKREKAGKKIVLGPLGRDR